MNIEAIVKDNVVRFVQYRQGRLFYRVRVPGETVDRTFPVSLADIGDETLAATGRANEFAHYIRKAIADGMFVRQAEYASTATFPRLPREGIRASAKAGR
jgi:hypothetical protein